MKSVADFGEIEKRKGRNFFPKMNGSSDWRTEPNVLIVHFLNEMPSMPKNHKCGQSIIKIIQKARPDSFSSGKGIRLFSWTSLFSGECAPLEDGLVFPAFWEKEKNE